MPRISEKQRVEDDISEYLLEMADMIEMDYIQASDSDNEILDIIDDFFDDLSYLEESQNKPYMATRYYSKANDPNNCNLAIEARLHADIGAGSLDVDVLTDPGVRLILESQGFSERNPQCIDLGSYFGGSTVTLVSCFRTVSLYAAWATSTLFFFPTKSLFSTSQSKSISSR
jgi:hypothetical protein